MLTLDIVIIKQATLIAKKGVEPSCGRPEQNPVSSPSSVCSLEKVIFSCWQVLNFCMQEGRATPPCRFLRLLRGQNEMKEAGECYALGRAIPSARLAGISSS